MDLRFVLSAARVNLRRGFTRKRRQLTGSRAGAKTALGCVGPSGTESTRRSDTRTISGGSEITPIRTGKAKETTGERTLRDVQPSTKDGGKITLRVGRPLGRADAPR